MDDLIVAGPKGGRHETLMGDLRGRFTFGKWKEAQQEATMYVGRRIRQAHDGTITMDWEKYIRERLSLVPISRERARDSGAECDDKEISQLRGILGVLGWVAREGRFDIVGIHSLLSSSFPRPTVRDLLDANAVVSRLLKTATLTIDLHPVDLDDGVFIGYSDASVGTAKEGASQGARIIGFCSSNTLKEGKGRCSLLHGHSRRLRRKCSSSLAAEAYAASATMGQMELAARFLQEVALGLRLSETQPPSGPDRCLAVLVTDSKSLYDHIFKGGAGACLYDKRCAIELGSSGRAWRNFMPRSDGSHIRR